MLRRQLVTFMLGLVLAGVLGYGLVRLFSLRLEHGDVYPAYSTLRADPLGGKAFFEALDALPGTEVRRNFRPLPRLRPPQSVTLIYTGVRQPGFTDILDEREQTRWGDEELRVFHALVASGSRAVFTFAPLRPEKPPRKKPVVKNDTAKPQESDTDEAPNEKKDGSEKGAKDGDTDKMKEAREVGTPFSEVAKKWGFEFRVVVREDRKPLASTATLTDPASDLEPEIAWHSAMYFDGLQPAWRTLYTHEGRAVVIERTWGNGSLVLVADSFLLSNEALGGSERRPRFLAALAGPHRSIVFDEEHHGVSEQTGIVDLGKKHRLHGLAAGLLLVAALFVWKNSVRFLPAYEVGIAADAAVSGRDAATGFTNLLRRAIPRGRILEACVAEWRKAFAHQPGELAKVEAAFASRQALPTRERDPVAGYQHIARTLAAGRPQRACPAPIPPPASANSPAS